MKSLSGIIALTTVLVLGLGAAAVGQDERPARRRAQPRESAPRSAPAPAAAPAPARQEPGATRSRGTDGYGRVRVPREAAGNPEPGRDSARREPRARAAEPATPPDASAPRTERRREPATAAPSEPRAATPAAAASAGDQDARRRAVPRGSRPRGDNPVVGRAVPRTSYPYPHGRSDGRRYPGSWGRSYPYGSRYHFYNNYYYYYPRRWYPYGYGAFGLGYFYYDPYTWYAYDPYGGRPAHYYGTYDSYYYSTGELRLQVHPRDAEVYVDGYFAGHVDDFDGMFQTLRLEDGGHTIEIVAPGYEPLVFDVRIVPGRKTTYRGELRPRP